MFERSNGISFSSGRQPAVRGIFSIVLSFVAAVLCVTAIVIAYKNKGAAGQAVGNLGIMALLASGLGAGFGISGLRKESRKRGLSLSGTILGGVVFVGMVLMFVKGF